MIFLISEDTLKSEGLLDDNLYGGYIRPAIQLAQDKGLQPAIGGVLYDKICSLVADGTIRSVENAKYKTLLDDYIQPYLLHQVLYEVSIPSTFKFKNQGVVQASNEYTQIPSMKDLQYVVQKYENDATFYLNRLTDYLVAHCTQYPEYHKHIDGKMDASKTSYDTGIYLGRRVSYSIRNDKPAE